MGLYFRKYKPIFYSCGSEFEFKSFILFFGFITSHIPFTFRGSHLFIVG